MLDVTWYTTLSSTLTNWFVKSLHRILLQLVFNHLRTPYRLNLSYYSNFIGSSHIADYRRYGVPTIRTDLPAPRIRRVDDRKNYGDESDAYGLVNPSIFSQKGVFEKDFLLPRSKEEVIYTDVYTLKSCILYTDKLVVTVTCEKGPSVISDNFFVQNIYMIDINP